jgi:hypothetical protein
MNLPLSLVSICDDAFALNILTREKRLKLMNYRAFYMLKNELIKYLYQHGYCVEVLEHMQQLECWTCEGEGCARCDDTGIYRTIYLYAFIFRVQGKLFKWHQLQNKCDYAVTLTDATQRPYDAPPSRDIVQMTERSEIWAFLRLWFGLWLCGMRSLPRIQADILLERMFLPERLRVPWCTLRRAVREAWHEFLDKFPVKRCQNCGRLYLTRNSRWSDFYHFCSRQCSENWVPF